jgi:hypothetical protein
MSELILKLIFITLNIIRNVFEYILILLLATVIQRYFNFSMEVLVLTGIFLFLIKQ